MDNSMCWNVVKCEVQPVFPSTVQLNVQQNEPMSEHCLGYFGISVYTITPTDDKDS